MLRLVAWVREVLVPELGPFGLFFIAFVDSSFLSLPEVNDFLVVTAGSVHPGTAWLYVAMTTLGSLGGCTVLWWIGRTGGEPWLQRRYGAERLARTREAFKRSEVLALAIPAMLPPPMPFKIFALSAGVFGLPYSRFALTLLVARGVRYSFWAAMGARYGNRALELLQRVDHWFADRLPWVLLFLACVVAAALGVLLARRLLRARSSAA